MLSTSSLQFSYHAARPVLRELSIALEPGRMTAIVGPNGAGKSTLLRLLAGVLRPGAGQVALDGQDLGSFSYKDRARRLAYVPQKTSIAFAYTVRQYIGLGRYSSGSNDDAAAVDRALERTDLQARADEPLPELSAGQQQRAALARALAQLDLRSPPAGARALLADEPVAAMDPLHALQTMRLLHEQADGGLAVGVVLHDLSLALRWCDRAIALDSAGKLAGAGAAGEILNPDLLERLYGVRFARLQTPEGLAALIPAAN
jgi:iron complex transport system ATP-binding protein